MVKFKQTLTMKKMIAFEFWDHRGIIFVNFTDPATTINRERYRKTLIDLRRAIKSKRPELLTSEVELLNDNARSYYAHAIRTT